jgi:uncharacterized protein (DUF1800 family)
MDGESTFSALAVCEDAIEIDEPAHRRAASPAGAVPLLALAVAACGGGGGSGSVGTEGGAGPAAPVVLKPQSDQQAARFLLQTGVAASTAEIAELKAEGYAPWLDRQMAAAPVSAVSWLAARGYTQVDANRWFDRTEPGDYMVWNQLMGGGPEARARAALALSEFFVVSLDGLDFRWKSQGMARYWDILSENAFGNFRTLLEQVTLNPAMGQWLNTLGNRGADGRGRVPDENYSREVMQLFTIGLYQLNADGTPRAGPNGQPVETYTNTDVQELAKVFTGYDFDWTGTTRIPDPQNAGQFIDSVDYALKPMTADPTKWRSPRTTGYHSSESKSFLGATIPAGTSAAENLRLGLDTLFNHPNVGPFFARQMIQRLVTSNPAPGYVQRVAAVFANNGKGVRGDLTAVFRAIWLDEEALAAANATSNSFGKIREPILRLAQWARSFGASSKSGNWTVASTSDLANRLAQSPLRSASVFNFFRPGYVPANSSTALNAMVAPELQLVNESTAPAYVNFMQRVIAGQEGATSDLATPYTEEVAIAHDSTRLLDRLDLLLTAGQLSPESRGLIKGALDATVVSEASDAATKLRRVQTAVLLVMAAPEYLLQR